MIFNNYQRLLFVFGVLLLVFGRTVFALEKIENYQVTFLKCKYANSDWLGLRELKINGHDSVFLVHTKSLQTALTAKKNLSCKPATAEFLHDSNYEKLRTQAVSNKNPTQNAGLQNLQGSGVYLTVDLCPSSRHFEKSLFDWSLKNKTPMGIAITGRWLDKHQDELQELLNLQKQGVRLSWINHTHNHPYRRGLPNTQNFLLTEGISLRDEVLGSEIRMIEYGLTPSVFFRFPGLISSPALMEQVLAWGLIPMGADAWLALGQKPQPGSIVLVHGNGNEHHGVELFFEHLEQISKLGFLPVPGSP